MKITFDNFALTNLESERHLSRILGAIARKSNWRRNLGKKHQSLSLLKWLTSSKKKRENIIPPELFAEIAIFAETGAVNGHFLTDDGFRAGATSQDCLLHSHWWTIAYSPRLFSFWF